MVSLGSVQAFANLASFLKETLSESLDFAPWAMILSCLSTLFASTLSLHVQRLRRIKEWMYLNLVRRLECANPDHALTICDEGEERSEERSEARSETKRGVKRSEERSDGWAKGWGEAKAKGASNILPSRFAHHSQNVLNAIPDEVEDSLALRIVEMFKDPNKHLSYLKSEQFAMDILTMASRVRPVLEDEPRCIFLQSPCYVFGDIHGNLEDLHFFSDNIWRLGMSLTAGNFLFLGDYVDRGLSCLEVVAYLFAMKLLLPHKVFLLRGNHETRDVNGWEEHYGERSYIHQCRERFGEEVGYRVWEETNQVFDRIPLSAVIDQDIFCVHGGIPRAVSRESR